MEKNFNHSERYLIGLILLITGGLFGFNCTQQKSEPVAPQKIIKANYRGITRVDHGTLEMTGQGEDQIYIVKVWGTPYDMGKEVVRSRSAPAKLMG